KDLVRPEHGARQRGLGLAATNGGVGARRPVGEMDDAGARGAGEQRACTDDVVTGMSGDYQQEPTPPCDVRERGVERASTVHSTLGNYGARRPPSGLPGSVIAWRPAMTEPPEYVLHRTKDGGYTYEEGGRRVAIARGVRRHLRALRRQLSQRRQR